jgi:hypothetical protein
MRRLTSFLILLVTTLLLCPAVEPQKPVGKTKPSCDVIPLPFSSGALQDLFKSYNRQYWRGKLPKTTVVWTALPTRFGETHQNEKNDYSADFGESEREDDGTFVIRLDVVKNREANVAKTTILHEMCHIKTWGEPCHQQGVPDDCRRWLAELHRIMMEGAFDDIV